MTDSKRISLYACPKCKKKIVIKEIYENLFGMRLWTDSYLVSPSFQISPIFFKCNKCSSFIWLENIQTTKQYSLSLLRKSIAWILIAILLLLFVIEYWQLFVLINLLFLILCNFFILLFVYFFRSFFLPLFFGVKNLSNGEILDLIDKCCWESKKQEIDLRTSAWWKSNDNFRYKKNSGSERSDRNLANMKKLFDLLDESLSEERIKKSELARELGMFSVAIDLLKNDDCDLSQRIKKEAQKKNISVQEISLYPE